MFSEVQGASHFQWFFFFSSDDTENILNIKKSAQHPKSFTNSGFLINLPLHFLSFEIPLVFSLIPINLALSMKLLFPTLSDLLTNHVRYDIMYTHINTHTPASYTYIIENKYLSMGLILPWWLFFATLILEHSFRYRFNHLFLRNDSLTFWVLSVNPVVLPYE